MPSCLQLLMEPSNKLLSSAKVMNPRGCSIDVDRHLQKPVLILKGMVSETSVRLPREDRPLSSLQLHDSLLAAQVCLDALSHFALDIVVSQAGTRRTKLVIGTHVNVAKYDEDADGYVTAYLPLIIPRSKWVQVVFHVAGIVQAVFALPPCKCIDTIAVAGTVKLCLLYTSSDEQVCIDATPENMALFAVPAYAPPIWKTASSGAEDSTSLPLLEAASTAPVADALARACSPSSSAPLSPSPPPAHEKPPGHHSRLLPLVSSPPPEPAARPSIASARVDSARPYQKCDYIRLVEDDGVPTTDEAYCGRAPFGEICPQSGGPESGGRRLLGNGVRGAADNTSGGLGGWEQPSDERRPGAATSSPGRAAKVEPSRRPPPRKGAAGSPGSGPGDSERLQRIIAARKRQVSPRQNITAATGPRSRSTGSRRQQRLRRRMRVLRANEQKVNRAAAAKTLAASEIPLAQHAELPADCMASSATSLFDAPLCGFGFGYLGVLKSNGEYEEDEDANLNLRGALTLNSDGE